jgi:hypothetical protein
MGSRPAPDIEYRPKGRLGERKLVQFFIAGGDVLVFGFGGEQLVIEGLLRHAVLHVALDS